MNVNINGKDYELVFGFAFLRKLDRIYSVVSDAGFTIGTGLQKVVLSLKVVDPLILPDLIDCGLAHTKEVFTDEELEDAAFELVSEQGLKKVCDHFLAIFRKQPLLSDKIKQIESEMKENEKMTEEMLDRIAQKVADQAKIGGNMA